MNPHERVVQLSLSKPHTRLHIGGELCCRYLLIPNCELALSLLVGLCECLQLLDRFRLQHCDQELGVRPSVLVAGLMLVFSFAKTVSWMLDELLTKTLVSSGSALNVSFNALCISSGVPSKKRPQPALRISQARGRMDLQSSSVKAYRR